MIAIAVDDEALMLGALVAAIEASPDISKVTKFLNCDEALEFAKNNSIDVAFLDINMRGMGGLALAEKIVASRPNCKTVFCTGYEEYAIPAFKLHASGYLMKPIRIIAFWWRMTGLDLIRTFYLTRENTLVFAIFVED